jgi:hypothetical protein
VSNFLGSLHTFVHDACRPIIEKYVQQFKRLIETGEPALLTELRTMWEQEQRRVQPGEFGEQPIAFADLQKWIPAVLAKLAVVVDNYKSQQRLSYEEPSTIQIVIGGDTLSRGLTLEGLTVSYFLRSASAYDTLLQMGRWFGYRPHYADLTRMWMTMELAHYFYDLATIEEEIRIDIRRYADENITPLDFAVRVRTHPNLNITSAMKMDAAVPAQVSYNNRRVQTVLFKRKNFEWLNHNLQTGRRLVKRLIDTGQPLQTLTPNTYRFQHVPVSFILDFLRDYRFHEDSTELSSDLLVRYIQDLNEIKDLLYWNVVVNGGSEPHQIDMGGIVVNAVKRTRRNETREDAHIGALMSEGDVNIDQAVDPELIRGKTDTEALKYRPPGIGLLILYPIYQHSGRGESMSERRAEMDAAADVLGVGLVFPHSQQFVKHMYMSADLSRVPREQSEWDMDEGEEV